MRRFPNLKILKTREPVKNTSTLSYKVFEQNYKQNKIKIDEEIINTSKLLKFISTRDNSRTS